MLTEASYGKSRVRLVTVRRTAGRHELRDLTVDIALHGEFTAAHVDGDNTGMVATDTMRNTVYALAKRLPLDQPEPFAAALVAHFLAGPELVHGARVRIAAHPWERLGDHEHAFAAAGGGDRIAIASGARGGTPELEGGIEGLRVLRTTGSGWAGFDRDEYTTLPETDDRVFATSVTSTWSLGTELDRDFARLHDGVRQTLLDSFADHYSPSAQFTLHRMGTAVIEKHPEIDRIRLSLPNQHHILFGIDRFGLENDNEVFIATPEPYGLIEATVERG